MSEPDEAPPPAEKSASPAPEHAPAAPPAKPRVLGLPFAKGYDPRRGHGPKPGGGGRPTNAFVERMRALAARGVPEEILAELDPALMAQLRASHPLIWMQFERLRLDCWREASDRGHGKPALGVEVVGDAAARERLRGLSDEELVAAYIATLDVDDTDEDTDAEATEEPSEEPKQLGEGEHADEDGQEHGNAAEE